jgi:phage virion morphogenesis protein
MLEFNFKAGSDIEVERKLTKLTDATDSKAILDESAALLLNRIRTRFLSQTAPDGTKWTESQAAKDRARSGRGGGTLYDKGTLFHSIQLSNHGDSGRMIGTDVPYAGFVNYGTIKLPPRIFMGVSDGDVDLVEKLIIRRIEKAMS